MRRIKARLVTLFVVGAVMVCSCALKDEGINVLTPQTFDSSDTGEASYEPEDNDSTVPAGITLEDIPEYDGTPFVYINGNVPSFTTEELNQAASSESFYVLSEMDWLGRCGVAYGKFGPETIAEGERGSIGHIRPSGWHTQKYPGVIPDLYLYNRCHLLMYKVSNILDDERNLITGTRYLNVEGMLPFEDSILDYIYASNNHVLYRVAPIFEDENLVASGVHMEAYSLEDSGVGLSFNVYCYNVQPGITIDYATGESQLQ